MKKKVCVECGNYFLAKVYNKRYCSGCEGANQKHLIQAVNLKIVGSLIT